PGRRHAGRCLAAELPVLRRGRGEAAGGGAPGRCAGGRRRLHRLRSVHGLHRAPDRGGVERDRAREPDEPGSAPADGRVRDRAAGEERRRVGWPGPGDRAGAPGRQLTRGGEAVSGTTTGRQLVPTSAPWASVVGYSRAVRVGNVIHVAGTAPIDDAGRVVAPGD